MLVVVGIVWVELLIWIIEGVDVVIFIVVVFFVEFGNILLGDKVSIIVCSDLVMSGEFCFLLFEKMFSLLFKCEDVFFWDWCLLG